MYTKQQEAENKSEDEDMEATKKIDFTDKEMMIAIEEVLRSMIQEKKYTNLPNMLR
jgi:hypothetical protein